MFVQRLHKLCLLPLIVFSLQAQEPFDDPSLVTVRVQLGVGDKAPATVTQPSGTRWYPAAEPSASGVWNGTVSVSGGKLAGLASLRRRPADVVGLHQAAAGREEDALRSVEQLKSMRSQRYVGASLISWAYLLVDLDKAFEWLEIALEERDGTLLVLKHHPVCGPYARDPRFADVLRRVGFPE
jgi:hypothetical protein